jgi:hypothetical protein
MNSRYRTENFPRKWCRKFVPEYTSTLCALPLILTHHSALSHGNVYLKYEQCLKMYYFINSSTITQSTVMGNDKIFKVFPTCRSELVTIETGQVNVEEREYFTNMLCILCTGQNAERLARR